MTNKGLNTGIEFHTKTKYEEFFIFQATVLKFGNFRGIEVGQKCKNFCNVCKITPAKQKTKG